jgi:hypothetical protein
VAGPESLSLLLTRHECFPPPRLCPRMPFPVSVGFTVERRLNSRCSLPLSRSSQSFPRASPISPWGTGECIRFGKPQVRGTETSSGSQKAPSLTEYGVHGNRTHHVDSRTEHGLAEPILHYRQSFPQSWPKGRPPPTSLPAITVAGYWSRLGSVPISRFPGPFPPRSRGTVPDSAIGPHLPLPRRVPWLGDRVDRACLDSILGGVERDLVAIPRAKSWGYSRSMLPPPVSNMPGIANLGAESTPRLAVLTQKGLTDAES